MPIETPLRILLVEDSSCQAQIVQHMLASSERHRFEVQHVECVETALRRLTTQGFDLVLLDLSLPDASGLDGFSRIRAAVPDLPVVILSGTDDEKTALAALENGAQDYVRKSGLAGDLLCRAVRYAAERAKMEARLADARALHAVAELAGGAAHHLNNVLAVIIARLQLLRARTAIEDPEINRVLEIVERSARHGSEVVRRLRGFSNRRSRDARPVRLDIVAAEVVEETRPHRESVASEDGIRLDVRLLAEPVDPVLADPLALKEALANLIQNSIDALPGGGRITVTTWMSESAVHCSVMDTGMGMPEHVRRRAIEPFFSTKGPAAMGLGLSLVNGVVERYDGRLTVESADGQGTTVLIMLPRATAAAAAAPPAHQPSDFSMSGSVK